MTQSCNCFAMLSSFTLILLFQFRQSSTTASIICRVPLFTVAPWSDGRPNVMGTLGFVRRPIKCDRHASFHTLIVFHDGENETHN